MLSASLNKTFLSFSIYKPDVYVCLFHSFIQTSIHPSLHPFSSLLIDSSIPKNILLCNASTSAAQISCWYTILKCQLSPSVTGSPIYLLRSVVQWLHRWSKESAGRYWVRISITAQSHLVFKDKMNRCKAATPFSL